MIQFTGVLIIFSYSVIVGSIVTFGVNTRLDSETRMEIHGLIS